MIKLPPIQTQQSALGGNIDIQYHQSNVRSSKTKRNPNPSPTGTRFGFLLFGTGNRGRWTCRGFDLAVASPKERLRVLSCVCLALSRRPTKKDNLWLSFSVGTGNRGRWTCRGYVLAVVSSKEYAAHILSRTCLALLPILKKETSHEGCFPFWYG